MAGGVARGADVPTVAVRFVDYSSEFTASEAQKHAEIEVGLLLELVDELVTELSKDAGPTSAWVLANARLQLSGVAEQGPGRFCQLDGALDSHGHEVPRATLRRGHTEVSRVSLVVATQNESAGHLSALDTAAAELRERLADQEIGACTPVNARPGTKAEIEQAVSSAIRTAGKHGAVLVLAFLGHGFTTDQDSHLYYVASDTRFGSPASGVDVARLIAEAADEPGVAGVIVLIDTCDAASGVPDMRRIIGGAGGGHTQVAVLFASTAGQSAFDMQFTHALNSVLRDGIAGAGSRLHLSNDLVARLRTVIVGQAVGHLTYDANPYAMGELWLARNAAYQIGAVTDVVGPTGQDRLLDQQPIKEAAGAVTIYIINGDGTVINNLHQDARGGSATAIQGNLAPVATSADDSTAIGSQTASGEGAAVLGNQTASAHSSIAAGLQVGLAGSKQQEGFFKRWRKLGIITAFATVAVLGTAVADWLGWTPW